MSKFSNYANKATKETETRKDELIFVSAESVYDSDLLKVDVGHYEKDEKATGEDKMYIRTFYQDKKTDSFKPSKAIGIDFDTFEELYAGLKKFMEDEEA